MYIRKKRNRSGSITVVAVSKSRGFYEEVRNFGTADSDETVRMVDNKEAVLLNGTQLLLNQVYDSIGFNQIPDEILRHLVIAIGLKTGSWTSQATKPSPI